MVCCVFCLDVVLVWLIWVGLVFVGFGCGFGCVEIRFGGFGC